MTLELGGKSPVIIDGANLGEGVLEIAARRVMWGKVNNSGQVRVFGFFSFRFREVFLCSILWFAFVWTSVVVAFGFVGVGAFSPREGERDVKWRRGAWMGGEGRQDLGSTVDRSM